MANIKANWIVYDDHAVLKIKNVNPKSEDANDIPLDIVFCQDKSGSMDSVVSSKDNTWYGTKLQLCKETQKFVVNKLGSKRLGIVTFDSGVQELVKLDTIHDKTAVNNKIDYIIPGSCTNLSGGLHQSMRMFKSSKETSVKYLIVFTDGLANEGITTEEGLHNLVKENVPSIPGGVKLVILGYGKDCNHDLLQSMASSIDGSFHYLDNADDIPTAIGEEFGTALQTRQQNLKLEIDPSVVEPLNYKFTDGTVNIGDLLQDETRNILFEINNPEEFKEYLCHLDYLDCETSKASAIKIDQSETETNEIVVSENINIHDATKTTKAAADAPLEKRTCLLQECIVRISNSKSSHTDTSKRLLEALNGQLEMCHLLPPASLRQFSDCTRLQRGGVYSDSVVSGMRSCSMGGVKRAVTASITNSSPNSTPHSLPHIPKLNFNLRPPVLQRQMSEPPKLNRSPGTEDLFRFNPNPLYPGAMSTCDAITPRFDEDEGEMALAKDPIDMV